MSVGNGVTISDTLERRATVRLIRYWHGLRRSERGCFFQDFKPHRNPIAWDSCFLLRIAPDTSGLHFEHLGRALISAFFEGPMPAQPVPAAELISSLFGDPHAALAGSELIKREGAFQKPRGAVVLYRSVLLPFIAARGVGGYVLGAVTHRVQPAKVGEMHALRIPA
jgi:hypothetical protein